MIRVPENPWVRDDGLDMQGLMAAFQDFWRENADMNQAPFAYRDLPLHGPPRRHRRLARRLRSRPRQAVGRQDLVDRHCLSAIEKDAGLL